MVICDGFNVPNTPTSPSSLTNETINGANSSINNNGASMPFPRPPPVPLARQSISSNGNGINNHSSSKENKNGNQQDNLDTASKQIKQAPNKLAVISSSSCNYDNLRSIDSGDDCHLTSPDTNIPSYNFNTSASTPKMPTSISFTQKPSNGNHYTKMPISNSSASTPINPLNAINNIQNQQANSLPITDKNLMSNIMNKTNISINDPKSQSMFTHNNLNTPVAPANVSFYFFLEGVKFNFYLNFVSKF